MYLKKIIFLLLFTTLSAFAASERPILIFASGRGALDAQVIMRELHANTVVNWEIADGGEWVDADEFQHYSCVIISVQNEASTQPWTQEDVEKIEAWVASGGRLLLIGGSPMLLSESGADLTTLEPILGAKKLTKAGMLSLWMNGDPEFVESDRGNTWMEEGGTALRGLTHLQIIAGWKGKSPGALCGSTQIDQGKVLYLGVSPSRLNDADQLSSIMSMITTFIKGATPSTAQINQSDWGVEPLGKSIEVAQSPVAPVKRELKSNYVSRPASGPDLVFSDNGKALAAIVVPAQPSSAVHQAVEELQSAFLKMSGAHFSVLTESEFATSKKDYPSAIFLGATQLAKDFKWDSLPSEGYRIKSTENILIVAGNDVRSNGMPLMGTYFGVIALLERHFGVRWLWPGELGSIYPRTSSLRLSAIDEEDAPALAQRRIRNAGGVARISMEPESVDLSDKDAIARLFEEYKTASSVRRIITGLSHLQQSFEDYSTSYKIAPQWFRRQKLGGSFRLSYTHAYDDYYERYGEAHPDWFAMQPDGSRKQAAERVRLCKANRELTEEIAKNVLLAANDPHAGDSISISPNDGGAENLFCMCKECRQLDPPNAPPIDFVFTQNGQKHSVRYPAITDRVVDFYNRIASAVAAKNPEVKMGAYAYSFYRTPPLQHTLHPNVIIGFVGTGYFDDHRLQQDRQSWEGWATKSNQLFLRPNALHLGHGFPGVFVHKLDRDIKHFYQTGMIGSDYDSIVHHWSTQGLNYYVLARLLWDPSQDVDALIEDYCNAAFGSASTTIKKYFTMVEELTNLAAASVGQRVDEVLRDEEIVDPRRMVLGMFLTVAPSVYTPERLLELEEILDQAKTETANPEEQKRIEFLKTGLEYARLQSALYKLVEADKVPSKESEALMMERQEFFKTTFQNSFFAIGLVEIARRETGLYRQHADAVVP